MRVTIESGPTLDVSEVKLIRAMGEPTEWRFVLHTVRESQSDEDIVKISNLLSRGPTKAAVSDPAFGLRQPGGPAIIVGAEWQAGSISALELRAIRTEVNSSSNPFAPRRRVHRVLTMRTLIDKFIESSVCSASAGVLDELDRIEFPEAEHTSIIQDGVSDWDFVGAIMDQSLLLRAGAPWLPLTMTGSLERDSLGKWMIIAGKRAAYEVWGDVERRKVEFTDGEGSDGYPQYRFSGKPPDVRSIDFPHGKVPSAIFVREHRKFDPQTWTGWTSLDVPRFTAAGAMISRIEDRLYHGGQSIIEWDSELWTLPDEALIGSPIPPRALTPWMGLGRVKSNSRKGAWLQVELAGFEEGENLADVRLTTPFSGADERKGVHLVPERGTEVAVHWSGRFDASLLLGANTRRQDTVFNSPSAYLEELYTGQYADVRIPDIGQVLVESQFRMGVNQETHVSSKRPLHVKADGADLKMNSGIVYTGRGL